VARHYPDEREGDGDERSLQAPDGVEQRDVRAGGGDEEEAEGDAAGLEVLPQRVGDVGPPNRPRHPHDRRAPASPVRVHPVVAVAVVVVVVMAVVVVVMVVVTMAVAAVRAGGEEQGRAGGEEERRAAGEGEGFGRGAAAAEVREGRGPREAEEVRGRRDRGGDRGGGGGGGEELHRGGRRAAARGKAEMGLEIDRFGEAVDAAAACWCWW
jgi:hypothetical protein